MSTFWLADALPQSGVHVTECFGEDRRIIKIIQSVYDSPVKTDSMVLNKFTNNPSDVFNCQVSLLDKVRRIRTHTSSLFKTHNHYSRHNIIWFWLPVKFMESLEYLFCVLLCSEVMSVKHCFVLEFRQYAYVCFCAIFFDALELLISPPDQRV